MSGQKTKAMSLYLQGSEWIKNKATTKLTLALKHSRSQRVHRVTRKACCTYQQGPPKNANYPNNFQWQSVVLLSPANNALLFQPDSSSAPENYESPGPASGGESLSLRSRGSDPGDAIGSRTSASARSGLCGYKTGFGQKKSVSSACALFQCRKVQTRFKFPVRFSSSHSTRKYLHVRSFTRYPKIAVGHLFCKQPHQSLVLPQSENRSPSLVL